MTEKNEGKVENSNGVFVRFADETLSDIEKLVAQKEFKNKQDFIRAAVDAYLDAYVAMKSAATKTFVNHLSEPIAN